MSKSKQDSGISWPMFLTILFFFMKIVGGIDWSWWWVFSPLWITALLILFVAVIYGLTK